MTDLNASLQRVRETSRRLLALQAQGWSGVRDTSIVTLTKSGDSPATLLSELDAEQSAFDSITVVGVFGSASLDVAISGSGHKTVTRQSVVDIPRTFSREMLETAEDAWAGDVDSALSLPGSWEVTVRHDLSGAVTAAKPDLVWRVIPTVADLELLISRDPVWSLGPIFDTDKLVIFLIEQLSDQQELRLGHSAVVPLSSEIVVADAACALVQQKRGQWGIAELSEAASPSSLAPSFRVGIELAALEQSMWLRCATMSWVGLSTRVELDRAASKLVLEVFGLQRVAHQINSAGLSIGDDQARRAYELFEWASGSNAVDQRFALQQVASLYRDVPPWAKSDDVFDAALAVFSTLRRDAVSEVLLAIRAARAFAIEMANRAAERTAAIARSTVERCVATLLAIGGVIVAQTTKAITESQAHDLRLLLVVLLLGLIAWNVMVESPPVGSSIKSLRRDFNTIADLLTERERNEILQLDAVTSVFGRARFIRVAVPAVYVAVAIAAWTVR